jgi:hypothetical protein
MRTSREPEQGADWLAIQASRLLESPKGVVAGLMTVLLRPLRVSSRPVVLDGQYRDLRCVCVKYGAPRASQSL